MCLRKRDRRIGKFAAAVIAVFFCAAIVPAQEPAASSTPAASISVGIVVDNSGSFRMIFERVVSATHSVIDSLRPDDEAFLATFIDSPKIVLRQEMTREKDGLKDAADNMFIEAGPTAILDAVVVTARYMAGHAVSDGQRQRVLVLITDGDERESTASLDQAIKAAKDAKVRIFVLGLYDESFSNKIVDRLVKETGGAKFVPKRPKDTAESVNSLISAIRPK
ncbi:MAG: VWA domain-containing protein [Acidobacteria bacterium]|nr:VWA domain-containing protein [Acidobacteriota bacterium]